MLKSTEIKDLAEALAKFQGNIASIKKDSINPFFKSKYADLASFIETIRKPLSDNGLAYAQFPTGFGGLTTILMHTSGQWIEDTMEMRPTDDKPQSVGSAITYARRYALGAVLGLATEDDDDGNAASAGKATGDFDKLLNMAKTATPDVLADLNAKLQKSDKYTAKQKADFKAAVEARAKADA